MGIGDAAAVAQALFPATVVATPEGDLPLPLVMVAIAGAESGWDARAAGDSGLPGPHCTGMAHGRPVVAATSWGLWQIHNVHGDFLRRATGSEDPCAWAEWLYEPGNNARAALHVLGPDPQRGLVNWSTWGGPWTPWPPGHGPYRAHIAAATAAVRP